MSPVTSTIDSTPTFHYQSLPPKILSRIFRYLWVQDRKHARCACKSWYESSLDPELTAREKFFYGQHNVNGAVRKEFAEVLANTKSEYINLQLDMLDADELEGVSEDVVWKRCGNRVRTFTVFVPSSVKKGNPEYSHLIANVITYCVNLESLTIGNASEWFLSPALLDSLLQKRIRRTEELRTFVYYFTPEATERNAYLVKNDETLSRIFSLFPNIEDLRLGTLWYWRGSDVCKSKMGECLNLLTRLRRISVNIETSGSWMATISEPEWALRFIAFEAQFSMNASLMNTLLTFFQNQGDLQTVMMRLSDISNNDAKKLVLNILECCPLLRDLRLAFRGGLTWSLRYKEFAKFESMVRKLEELKLSNCQITVLLSSGERIPSTRPKLFDFKIEYKMQGKNMRV